MPRYDYQCACGTRFEVITRMTQVREQEVCRCGLLAARVFSAPALVCPQDVCYDSPIDGSPITSRQARLEDMKRNGCVEYDPGMKADRERRIKDDERALDRSVDEFVGKTVTKMDSKTRGKLYSEIVHQGADPVYTRSAPDASSLT